MNMTTSEAIEASRVPRPAFIGTPRERKLVLIRVKAPLSLRVFALPPKIAKRTQFHSKHIALQILTTEKFLFLSKANLMIPNNVQGAHAPLRLCVNNKKTQNKPHLCHTATLQFK
jgi:hypothetical protein